jgi:hypothetical protein
VNLKLVAAGSAAALALCGAGAAAAGSSPGQTQHTTQAVDVMAGVAVFDAALAYLQIDHQLLVQVLRSGQSHAQIAVAQG